MQNNSDKTNYLVQLLQADRLTEIVDVGANPIDGSPPYAPMLNAGLCRVTGFEPQADELDNLNKQKSALERYLPYALGDGLPHTLHVCAYSGWTSLLKPSSTALSAFPHFTNHAKVVQEIPVQTKTLNSIAEIEHIDFLKIDIQGGEMSVFENGIDKLKDTVFIQTEISFIPLYEGQPGFGVIDSFLRKLGFLPHSFAAIKKWVIDPAIINNNPQQALNQLLEGDIVYTRNFLTGDGLTDEQIKHMALIAHICYNSFDLTARCIKLLEARNSLEAGSTQKYFHSLGNKPSNH